MMIGIMANFPRRRVAVLTARVAVLINVIFRFLEFVFFFPDLSVWDSKFQSYSSLLFIYFWFRKFLGNTKNFFFSRNIR